MRNAGLEEAQAGSKISWRSINNLRYADDTTLMAESEEELKSLLMKVKELPGKQGSQRWAIMYNLSLKATPLHKGSALLHWDSSYSKREEEQVTENENLSF